MKRTTLLAAATTIGAACFLPVAAPAQAAGCGVYTFPDAPTDAPAYDDFKFNVELVQDNGIHVYLQTTDNEVQQAMYVKPFAPDLINESFLTGGDPNPVTFPVNGAAAGGLKGRAIDFKVRWENQFTNVYTGQVNDDGSASGTTINNGGTPNTWHSAFADFKCAPAPWPDLGSVGSLAGQTEQGPPRKLGRDSVEDAPLQRQLVAPQVLPNNQATVVGEDVDVYNAKNEPDGAGQIVGVLRVGNTVTPVGNCSPDSWCEVSGDSVPSGHGWVWGHLELP